MPGVALSENWPDLLEPGLRKIFGDQYKEIPSMIPMVYTVESVDSSYVKDSGAGAFGDFAEFTGKVSYDERTQGYDKRTEFTEYALGFKVERKLAADDLYNIINRLPGGLAISARRTKESIGASIFNLAFTAEPTDGDGAELCASDHASTADSSYSKSNEGTSALSAAAVESTRILMSQFTDDRSNKISVSMDMIMVPRNLEETAWVIINSKGEVDTAENNPNFHQGRYKLAVWDYLDDSNNWFAVDSMMNKQIGVYFYNREPLQFFQDKDSDTLLAKYIGYYRCGNSWVDWRWVFGHLVT